MTLSTHDLDDALRELDPGLAGPAAPDPAHLERILAGPGTGPGSGHEIGRPAPRRRVGAPLWGLAAAAATVLAVSVWPGADDQAYAGWTALPTGVPAQDVEALAQDCRTALLDDPPGSLDEPSAVSAGVPLSQLRPVLAERRGEATVTMMQGGGHLGHCWFESVDGRGAAGISVATDVDHRPAADSLSLMVFNGMADDPGPNGLAPAVVIAGGRVGEDVTAVTLHEEGQVPVRATVADGYWTAWWPSEIPDGFMPTPVAMTADVTLVDGAVVEGVALIEVVNLEADWWPEPRPTP